MIENNQIKLVDFVDLLWQRYCNSKFSTLQEQESGLQGKALLHFGHLGLWLEDQDEVNSESYLDRRTCARIIHQFMKIKMELPDLQDVSGAQVLKDLYTCRVCANHVAQIFVRGLMESYEIDSEEGLVQIFNMTELVTPFQAVALLEKVFSL